MDNVIYPKFSGILTRSTKNKLDCLNADMEDIKKLTSVVVDGGVNIFEKIKLIMILFDLIKKHSEFFKISKKTNSTSYSGFYDCVIKKAKEFSTKIYTFPYNEYNPVLEERDLFAKYLGDFIRHME